MDAGIPMEVHPFPLVLPVIKSIPTAQEIEALELRVKKLARTCVRMRLLVAVQIVVLFAICAAWPYLLPLSIPRALAAILAELGTLFIGIQYGSLSVEKDPTRRTVIMRVCASIFGLSAYETKRVAWRAANEAHVKAYIAWKIARED